MMRKSIALAFAAAVVLVLLLVLSAQLAWATPPAGRQLSPLAAPWGLGMDIVVTSTADSGNGTLRWAMSVAASGDTIVFRTLEFPPTNPATISLVSPLPEITQGNLTIDASAAGVILDGSALSSGDGLYITSDGNVIKALRIRFFPDDGVRIDGGASNNLIGGTNASPGGTCSGDCNVISGNGGFGVSIQGAGTMSNTVSGNYIGTDVNGTSALPNQSVGVRIFNKASHNLVGGSTPGERNVISGNGTDGVQIEWGGTTSNTVSGNYIGTDVNGTADLPNGLHGVEIDDSASHNTIGGNIPGERNIISGNSQTGVTISDGSAHNTVSGNYIGTDVNGTAALPNGSDGVSISASSSNLIGSGNVVVYNSRHGISVYGPSSSGNTITENSIYSNGGMGIELGDGGNLSLPAPVLTEVTTDTVKGASLPHATIEVFSDLEYEGQVYEGATVAEGAGHFTFTVGTAFSLDHVTATATDGLGNTSEFGAYLPHRIYLPVVVKSHSG